MDTMRSTTTSVQQKTLTKKTKAKKKNIPHPVKVVYISNPMKIKTSASQFMALVQELTGQDAESPPDPTRFHATDSSDDSSFKNIQNNAHLVNCVDPPAADPNFCQEVQQPSSLETSFEPLDDDVFMPQMIDNISALLPASLFGKKRQPVISDNETTWVEKDPFSFF